MFKLGETYYNKAGSSIRIICVDSKIKAIGGLCPIIGETTPKGGAAPNAVMYYDEAGRYAALAGKDYEVHHLISNEPTEDEQKLIDEVRCIVTDPNSRDADDRMLKVIRALRNK